MEQKKLEYGKKEKESNGLKMKINYIYIVNY